MSGPAEAVLASQVWTAGRETREHGNAVSILFTGCRSFDDALCSSFKCEDYGICCVSGDDGVVADVSQAFLISHLLNSASSTVVIIDARGSLDLLSLFTKLKSRLISHPRPDSLGDGERIHETATSLLDRIKIMRVFDYEGALEAIHEVRCGLAKPSQADEEIASGPALPRSTVPDSQADEDNEIPISVPVTQCIDSIDTSLRAETASGGIGDGETLLILDNLPGLILPITLKNHTKGQAILSDLLRSLRHLHTVHAVTSILQNDIVGVGQRRADPRSNDLIPDPAHRAQTDDGKTNTEQSSSIFTSTRIKPALGPLLAENVDLHLMIHPVPKTPQDARAQMAHEAIRTSGRYDNGRSRGQGGRHGDVRYVNMVEVLLDRHGERTGRFGAFDVGVDGLFRDAFA